MAVVSEESVAQILGGPCSSSGVDVTALGEGGSRNQAEGGHMHLRPTPVKTPRASSAHVPASMVLLWGCHQKVLLKLFFLFMSKKKLSSWWKVLVRKAKKQWSKRQ